MATPTMNDDDREGRPAPEELGWAERRRAMRAMILAQCFGGFAVVALTNNLILLYLTALEADSETTLFLLSLYPLGCFLMIIPFARLSDARGKKRVGRMGLVGTFAGFLTVALAAFAPEAWRVRIVGVGIVIYSVGSTAFVSNWFALISPVVPEALRGRFFGNLRFAWQLIGVVFSALTIPFLSVNTPLPVFQGVLAIVALAMLCRTVVYGAIPEVEKSRPARDPLLPTLLAILRQNDYASFCAYVFLLCLFTGCGVAVFGLVETRVLGFSDRTVALMGGLTMFGSMVGFLLAGQAVDRWGTHVVFIYCHFSYAALMFLFCARGAIPLPAPLTIAVVQTLFGFSIAGSSIAISSEMLALIPSHNKSLATALSYMMLQGGTALSGILSAKALQSGALAKEWSLYGLSMSRYDSILLGCGIMVLFLVVTLGLVPSVIRKSQWAPRGF